MSRVWAMFFFDIYKKKCFFYWRILFDIKVKLYQDSPLQSPAASIWRLHQAPSSRTRALALCAWPGPIWWSWSGPCHRHSDASDPAGSVVFSWLHGTFWDQKIICSCSVVCKCKLNLDIRAFTRKKVSQKKNRRHTPIAKILGFIE